MNSETLHLTIVIWISFGFLAILSLHSKDLLHQIRSVLPTRTAVLPMPDSDYDDPVKDLEHKIEMAENAYKWYQQCMNNDAPKTLKALDILLTHSIQAAARFAVQEARDGKVSKRPEEQRIRIEYLLESCFIGLTENGATEETAERTLKDGVTFALHGFEMSSTVLPEGIITNVAAQYFDIRDNRL